MAGTARDDDDRGMTYEPPTHDDQETRPSTALDDLRQARRSADDKVVAGVLGGLGRHFGIDPILLRVTTVVLAIFGGVGVLLYALGWLLFPREDGRSLLDEARGEPAQRSSGAVPLVLVLGIVVVFSLSNIISGSWDRTVLLLLTVAGLYLLLRRRTEDLDEGAQAKPPPGPPGGQWEPIPPSDAAVETGPTGFGYPHGWPEGPDWDVADRPSWSAPPPQPAEPAPAPEPTRSGLTAITLSLALIAFATLAINDATWATVPPGMYVALPLAIVGLGLLAAAWKGRRAKGLIAWGLVLALAVAPVTGLGKWEGVTVDARPTTLAELEGLVVHHPAGDVSYDLTAVPFTDEDEARVVFEQAIGDLTITLPPDVDATVVWSGGLGEASIFEQTFEGIQGGQRITDLGADGEGGGSITLVINFSVGELEVTR